jgi:hypothetical protein
MTQLAPHRRYSEGSVRLAYGKLPDGRIVHIADVPSGIACGCRCPGCEQMLVAKHCREKSDHFSHHNGFECNSARETAVHLLAKQVLEEALHIRLPEWSVSRRSRRTVLQKADTLRFDSAPLEQRMGNIIPDIVLHKLERSLLVEIAVTHPCGPEKIQRLRELELSAVEIDLSFLRYDAPLRVIRDAVLDRAERRWLSNPRLVAKQLSIEMEWKAAEAKEAARAERNRAAQLERNRKKAARFVTLLQLGDNDADQNSAEPSSPPMAPSGFGGYVGLEIVGDALVMSTSRAHWQSEIIATAVRFLRKYPTKSFTTDWIFQCLKKAHHVRSVGLTFMDREVEALVRKDLPDFRSPWMVVHTYLGLLAGDGILMKSGKHWRTGWKYLQIIR